MAVNSGCRLALFLFSITVPLEKVNRMLECDGMYGMCMMVISCTYSSPRFFNVTLFTSLVFEIHPLHSVDSLKIRGCLMSRRLKLENPLNGGLKQLVAPLFHPCNKYELVIV